MKSIRIIAALTTLLLASCVETTTTNPDGSVTKTKAPDRELVGQALTTAGQLAAAKYAADNQNTEHEINGDK